MDTIIITALHLLRDGTHLYINHGSSRKKSMLLITDPSDTNGMYTNDIRVIHRGALSSLRIRKHIIISEDNSVSIGPFTLRIDPVSLLNESGVFNVMINDRFYFLSRFPADPRRIGDRTVLLHAESGSEKQIITGLTNLLEKTHPEKIIVSGEASETVSDCCGNRCPIITHPFAQQETIPFH